MGDLDSRELRYFVAVAEELHFGCAAERLGIAPPPLSRAVRETERRFGVQLLNRDRRGVAFEERAPCPYLTGACTGRTASSDACSCQAGTPRTGRQS